MRKNTVYSAIFATILGYTPEILQNQLSKLEEKLIPTTSSTLPSNVAGYVNPGTQTGEGMQGFYDADMPDGAKEFVRQHELTHIFGIDGSARGEYWADALAAERTGNPYMMRGLPWYRPPLK